MKSKPRDAGGVEVTKRGEGPDGNDGSDRIEQCAVCSTETPHDVRIEIRTENEEAEHSSYSREPYRISVCAVCGEEIVRRMNDA